MIGTKSADECQALYSRFKSYLSLPKGIQHQVAFLAMVKDMVESESKVGPCHAHRSAASGSQGLLTLSCKVPPVRRLAYHSSQFVTEVGNPAMIARTCYLSMCA